MQYWFLRVHSFLLESYLPAIHVSYLKLGSSYPRDTCNDELVTSVRLNRLEVQMIPSVKTCLTVPLPDLYRWYFTVKLIFTDGTSPINREDPSVKLNKRIFTVNLSR